MIYCKGTNFRGGFNFAVFVGCCFMMKFKFCSTMHNHVISITVYKRVFQECCLVGQSMALIKYLRTIDNFPSPGPLSFMVPAKTIVEVNKQVSDVGQQGLKRG